MAYRLRIHDAWLAFVIGLGLLRDECGVCHDGRQWMALDWNTPALDFYAKLGAPLLDPAWRSLRMDRQQICRLACGGEQTSDVK